MQSLIPLVLAVSLASGARLSLVPYAYFSSPVPVFDHFQNTRTGEHAYSYAGGPSAKEEIKDADGILRGSYSYVDANGILQSAFYVADENGFRVAATNIPSDESSNGETSRIILARSADEAGSSRFGRRKRSSENSNLDSNENNANRSGRPENFVKGDKDGARDSPRTVSQPLLPSNGIPLATSRQSQVQAHSSARLDVAEGEAEAKPVDLQPILPVQTILEGLPVLARAPTYHENRIELHKQLGIEGPSPKDAVKINPEPLTIVRSSPPASSIVSTIVSRGTVAAVPVIAEQAIPVVAAAARIGTASVTKSISSHGVSQIHGPWKITDQDVAIPGVGSVVAKESIPVVTEAVSAIPIAKEANLATATVTTSVSSHGIGQIHGDSKVNIEPAWLVEAAPIAQLRPFVNVPIYLG